MEIAKSQDFIDLMGEPTEEDINKVKNILNKSIKKAKAYVKKPNDAPAGVKVHQGSEGGWYYNTEDNQNKPSPHSKVRLKRPDDAPKGVKVREDEDGFYYNSDDI